MFLGCLRSIIFSICIFSLFLMAQGSPILPEPFKLPAPPSSDNLGCSNCPLSTKSSSKPTLNYLANVTYKINLQEEDILPSQLLEVHLGSSTPFSLESRYLIHPPGSKSGFKDYFLADLGIYKVLFHVKVDELGTVDFYSYNYPGYAVKRSGDYLVLTDFNTNREYLFFSFDGGDNWKLKILRDRYQPSLAIKCKYNDEGLMSDIILPGDRSYKIEHRFGVAQKVTSPSGAVTTFTWSDDGTIKRIKTELTQEHPFYQFAQKPKQTHRSTGQNQQDQLPIVRDLHVECDITSRLTGLVTTGGEHYSAEYLRNPSSQGVINTGILTFPDGRKEFRRNTNFNGKRVSEKGIIVNNKGESRYIVQSSRNYVTQNKGLAYVGKMINGGLYKYERASGTLAITAETDPLGNTTRYKYNKFGLRYETSYQDGGKVTRKYDDNANLICEYDECGRIKTYERNEAGQVLKYTLGDLVTKYEYNSDGMPVKTIMADGTIFLFTWDKQARLVFYTRFDGIKVSYTYYGDLPYIKSITNTSSDGKEDYLRSFTYDIQGRLTQINYPDNTFEAFTYDCCDIIAQRSRAGAITRYKYDQGHRKTEEILPFGEIYKSEYDSQGQLIKRILPNKTTYTFTYDKFGRRISQTNPIGITENYSFNAMSILTKIIRDVDNASSTMKYDKRNRLSHVLGNLERNVGYKYDKSGNTLEFKDFGLPAFNVPRVTKYKYDKSNRRVSQINSKGIETKTVFKKASTQIDYKLSEKIYRFMQYDDFGRPVSISAVTAYELKQAPTQVDKNELLKSKRIKIFSYSIFGNLSELRDGTDNLLMKYEYQPDGTLLSTLRPVSDEAGELVSYRYRYSDDGEKITSVYKKLVPLKQHTAQK